MFNLSKTLFDRTTIYNSKTNCKGIKNFRIRREESPIMNSTIRQFHFLPVIFFSLFSSSSFLTFLSSLFYNPPWSLQSHSTSTPFPFPTLLFFMLLLSRWIIFPLFHWSILPFFLPFSYSSLKSNILNPQLTWIT